MRPQICNWIRIDSSRRIKGSLSRSRKRLARPSKSRSCTTVSSVERCWQPPNLQPNLPLTTRLMNPLEVLTVVNGTTSHGRTNTTIRDTQQAIMGQSVAPLRINPVVMLVGECHHRPHLAPLLVILPALVRIDLECALLVSKNHARRCPADAFQSSYSTWPLSAVCRSWRHARPAKCTRKRPRLISACFTATASTSHGQSQRQHGKWIWDEGRNESRKTTR